MTPFDERFADRVREVFDAYEEPVDEAAWERARSALARPAGAPDRPAAAGARTRRQRGLAVLAALLVASGGAWVVWQASTPDAPLVASAPERAPALAPLPPEAPGPAPRDGLAADPAGTTSPEGNDLERDTPSGPVRSAPAPARSGTSSTPTVRPTDRTTAGRRGRDVNGGAARIAPADPATADPAAPGPEPAAPALTDAAPSDPVAESAPPVSRDAPAPPSRSSDVPLADPAAPLVARVPAREEALPSPRLVTIEDGPQRGLDVVLATNAAFSEGRLAEGVGVTTGVSHEWRVGRRLAVSTGALAAYTRLALEPGAADGAVSLTDVANAPSRSLDVTTRSTLSTLALEVPIDVTVDLARAGAGRIRAGAGLTASLYLAQRFEDDVQTYALDPSSDVGVVPGQLDVFSSQTTETEDPFSHLDLARQVNLALGYALDRGPVPLTLDGTLRLPLGGVTSRDIPLTSVGLRLRIGL